MSDLGQFDIKRSNGLIFIDMTNHHVQDVIDVIKVFGIASVSPAYELEADMEEICKAAGCGGKTGGGALQLLKLKAGEEIRFSLNLLKSTRK